ncbi:MAG: caspase family protein, partial [Bacteroidota bacterium]
MAKEENRGLNWPGKDGSPVPRTNHLLVIGIDDYQHHRPLNNARRDAETFRDLMLNRYQFESANVYGLFDQDATRRNIIAALEALEQRLTERDSLLIYFSGHGTMNRRQTQGFWVPVDAGNEGTADYLANTRVRDILADMQVHHLYLIVDACFAGTMIVRKSENAHLELSEANPSRRVLSSGRQEVVSDGKPGEHSPFFTCLQHQLTQSLSTP